MTPPRPLEVDTFGNHWLEHDDGTVTRVIVRHVPAGEGSYVRYEFHGQNRAAALELVNRWQRANLERITEHARRRARWGIVA